MPTSASGAPTVKTNASQMMAGTLKSTPPPSVANPCAMVCCVDGSMTVELVPSSDVTTTGSIRFQCWKPAEKSTVPVEDVVGKQET